MLERRIKKMKENLINKETQLTQGKTSSLAGNHIMLGEKEIRYLASVFRQQISKELQPMKKDISVILEKISKKSQPARSQQKPSLPFQKAFNHYLPNSQKKTKLAKSKNQFHFNGQTLQKPLHIKSSKDEYSEEEAIKSQTLDHNQYDEFIESDCDEAKNQLASQTQKIKRESDRLRGKKAMDLSRSNSHLKAIFNEIKELINKRKAQQRHFLIKQKKRMVDLIDSARKYNLSIATLCFQTGIHKKWYTKWTNQINKIKM